ncbi:CDK-activating kinase assembly factor MAT1 [Nematocida major]|uniref:CDK-activating kinase assembly factor MAT1 n=1 Tax=Nematocida major TaxID=1912982 RepID=UPI0020085E8D|nr:CDK-activating kinase assembly factor MAT1 [Nematocida major]KAH9385683.1 CDK-activating kinase assembly factor MAT1 [Nematocida major]
MERLELFCPQCKSNSYINPGMKVFVSPCYHSLCEMCVSRLFSNGPNKCPECGISLRRSNYTSQTFEDVSIERECRVRKIVSSQIGKSLDDFSDEEDYNEHLERVEEVVEELLQMKGPKEITARMQEIRESMREEARTLDEPSKRRKIECIEEVKLTPHVDSVKYFFPPDAIEQSTIPKKVVSAGVFAELSRYRELASIMIRKASVSLNVGTL